MTSSPPPDTPRNDDDEGEDLLENMASDYNAAPELDVYEEEAIDDADISPMDMAARRGVNELLEARDRRQHRHRRQFVPHQLMEQDADIPLAIGQAARDQHDEFMEQAVEAQESLVNLEDFDGPLREWLDEDRVRREIQNRFKSFLTSYVDTAGNPVYPMKVKQMCQDNACSLAISYMHLSEFAAVLAIWLVEQPSIMLELFDAVAMDVAKISFPDYNTIHSKIHVRITNLPLTDELRDLRQLHLNSFVQVSGVVTRRSSVFPQLQLVRFDCLKCGFTTSPIAQNLASNSGGGGGGRRNDLVKPSQCPDCNSNGPFRLNESKTLYRNYQKIVLQESPGSVPAGRIPRSRDVILIDDLCDQVRPGEQVNITGVYKNIFDISINVVSGFPVFSTIIEANFIQREADYFQEFQITDEEKAFFTNVLSKTPDFEEQLLSKYMAPSIYGHDYIKRAILYALFGGQEKLHENKHRVRGDINILILGDPGTGKSQFLKYTEKIANRAVYSTGKGASAVGLTASVRRDKMSGEWTLEGGALVLADRGVCMIDEFDKMNEKDRVSIHEAMEQQSISVSKAGIIATLRARCCVIAAANPIRGRYDSSLTFVENVDLTDPILTRFDILAVVKDKVDIIHDEKLANFVVDSHIKYHPSEQVVDAAEEAEQQQQDSQASGNGNGGDGMPYVSQEMLKKYIMFAKQTCHPKLDNIDRDKIAEFYSDLRQKSMGSGGGIPIAVRHIESILRLSEARAKLYLRSYVRSDDVDMAIKIVLQSFIDTQKQSIQQTLRKHFKQYLTYNQDVNQLLLHLLNEEIDEEIKWRQMTSQRGAEEEEVDRQNLIELQLKDFQQRVQALSITNGNLNAFLKSNKFKDNGFSFDKKKKVITKYLS
eukprot:CAMPEP_0202687664 /NCGR_PEP_ID=MMETSP1385-20130828/3322_1 /ASSEMBLY_ACC=CAM_ASM_000861 /TAXON_ID=933848 /ORGANISM="Elphidium margaritaceum" /LENGTH=878 /DNA_ID=CAMNT_0049342499 /DNA_START=79 /DNA_END=2715 /DNA_ORIENTATION=-